MPEPAAPKIIMQQKTSVAEPEAIKIENENKWAFDDDESPITKGNTNRTNFAADNQQQVAESNKLWSEFKSLKEQHEQREKEREEKTKQEMERKRIEAEEERQRKLKMEEEQKKLVETERERARRQREQFQAQAKSKVEEENLSFMQHAQPSSMFNMHHK